MTLKRIAEQVNLHESTVSRAISGKYAQTAWGVYDLKYFFQSAISTDLGEPATSESVKTILKEWVRREDGQKPYSDQQLAVLLQERGIRISRRTVAKYREELGIPSSLKRKRKTIE